MKKKIKDLTVEEADKICDKQTCCNNCPLNIRFSKHCTTMIYNCKELLEREIEVEEE